MTDYVAAFTEVLWSENTQLYKHITSLPLNYTLKNIFSVVTTLDSKQLLLSVSLLGIVMMINSICHLLVFWFCAHLHVLIAEKTTVLNNWGQSNVLLMSNLVQLHTMYALWTENKLYCFMLRHRWTHLFYTKIIYLHSVWKK